MASALEIEVKFKVEDLDELAGRLLNDGFRLITPRTLEINHLYDLPDQPLQRQGVLLRIRRYGDRWTLTFKAKGMDGRHKSRKEIETRVEDGDALTSILEAIGFKTGFCYEKFRTEWADDQGDVVIDETPIGNFGEIEGPPEWIDDIARRLQIAPTQYITDSYATLFVKWKQRTGSNATDMKFTQNL